MIFGLGFIGAIPYLRRVIAVKVFILPALDFPVYGGDMYPELVGYGLLVYLLAEHDLEAESLFIRQVLVLFLFLFLFRLLSSM